MQKTGLLISEYKTEVQILLSKLVRKRRYLVQLVKDDDLEAQERNDTSTLKSILSENVGFQLRYTRINLESTECLFYKCSLFLQCCNHSDPVKLNRTDGSCGTPDELTETTVPIDQHVIIQD